MFFGNPKRKLQSQANCPIADACKSEIGEIGKVCSFSIFTPQLSYDNILLFYSINFRGVLFLFYWQIRTNTWFLPIHALWWRKADVQKVKHDIANRIRMLSVVRALHNLYVHCIRFKELCVVNNNQWSFKA